MNLANKLTISRIFLTAVFMFFLFSKGAAAKILALWTFLLASSTDFLDGYIARKTGRVTAFGAMMDPIADKILVLAAFLSFVEMRLVPAWMVAVILFREIAVTGLRGYAYAKGRVIPADDGGKHKMVSQLVSTFAILLFLIFRASGITAFGFWNAGTERIYKNAILLLMSITVILTLVSGLAYLIRNREVYSDAKAR